MTWELSRILFWTFFTIATGCLIVFAICEVGYAIHDARLRTEEYRDWLMNRRIK